MSKRKFKYALQGHSNIITRIAWSADGETLASASNDKTIRLWDVSGNLLDTYESPYNTITNLVWSPDGSALALSSIYEHIYIMNARSGMYQGKVLGHSGWVTSIAWSPDGKSIVSTCTDDIIRVWYAKNYILLENLKGHSGLIRCVAWSPDGKTLASSSSFGDIRLWDTDSWKQTQVLKGHLDSVDCLAWSSDTQKLASASTDSTIRVWDPENGKDIMIFKTEQKNVSSLSFSSEGSVLASMDESGSVCLWCCNTWEMVDDFNEPSSGRLHGGLAFNPRRPILASISQVKCEINLYDIEIDVPSSVKPLSDSSLNNYVRAKFILVSTESGESGNKIGIKQPQSTIKQKDDHHICSLDSQNVILDDGSSEIHEITLWDLTNHPGFKDFYQLYSKYLSGMLISFDSLSKTVIDGIRSWNQAFDQAHKSLNNNGSALNKVLIAIHPNPGDANDIIKPIEDLTKELGFDRYFITNKKELKDVEGLSYALYKMVTWENIPKVDSIKLFNSFNEFIIEEKKSGLLLLNTNDLFNAYINTNKSLAQTSDIRTQFDICIQHVESSGIVYQLNSGSLILLKPELLDTYVLAMINTVKDEPSGLGIISEKDALSGKFKIPVESRIKDKEQEKLFLTAIVEEFLFLKIAVRVTTSKGQLLVFPLQITRNDKDMDEPAGEAEIFQFKGPATNIFAALTVSISFSGMFKKKEIWKNGATFITTIGETCGMLLRKIDESCQELVLFSDSNMSPETDAQFGNYVNVNLTHLALPESINRQQILQKPEKALRPAPPSASINLEFLRSMDRCMQSDSKIDKTTDTKSVSPLKSSIESKTDFTPPKLKSQSFRSWAGSSKCTLALVFTDIVESTQLCNKLGNETFKKVRQAHFTQARRLLNKYNGYEIKTIGSSVMAAFRAASEVLDFGLELYKNTGDNRIKIRVGIHVGPVNIEQNDAFGVTVNYTARVESMSKRAEIWVSNEAKTHIDQEGSEQHSKIQWSSHPDCELKGFQGKYTLWSVDNP